MAVSNYTATTTSGTASAANETRQQLVITNIGTVNVFLNVGGAAIANMGYTLYPGGVWEMDRWIFTRDAVTAITASSTALLSIYET